MAYRWLMLLVVGGCGGIGAPSLNTTGDSSGGGESSSGSSGGGHVEVMPQFRDVTVQAGLGGVVHSHHVVAPDCLLDNASTDAPGDMCIPERMTGGVAVGDYDRDGFPDLFLTAIHGAPSLLHNEGDGTFTDRTGAAGITMGDGQNGAAWVDVDRDGDLDLYVTALGTERYFLFIGDGNGGFTEDAQARGAAIEATSMHLGTSVAVGDYDRDGFPDLFVGEWKRYKGVGDETSYARLLHNLGRDAPGHFEDATDAAGLSGLADIAGAFNEDSRGVYAFAPAFVDLDDDGWQDLAIAADFRASRLYWNDGDGTFTDGTELAGVGTDRNGMGATFGDVNGDGRLDWFVTAIDNGPLVEMGNRLYVNRGERRFKDMTDEFGVRIGGWAWGAALFDADNDTDLDLVSTAGWVNQGHIEDPMRLWLGGERPRAQVSTDVGLESIAQSRAVATFDYDLDGDLDLLVTHYDGGPILYRNETPAANDWLRVVVVGRVSEPEGHGVRVRVGAQVREIGASTHFLSQSERVAHFGLGTSGPVEVRITWPATGRETVLDAVEAGQVLVVPEP